MPNSQRIEALRKRLAALPQSSAYLVKKPENVRYLSAFSGSFALLVITPQDALLFSDARYETQAKEEASDFDFVLLQGQSWLEALPEFLLKKGIQRLLFDKREVNVHEYEGLGRSGLELEGRLDWVEKLRQIKSSDELAKIAAAQALAEEALEATLPSFRVGRSERELALELEWAMRSRGAEDLSFPTILASGARSAMPHGQASEKVLASGDLVVIDFGCVLDGYCSDMTRTFAMVEVEDWQEHLYETVCQAQNLALEHVQAGRTGAEMQALVQRYFDDAGFGNYFGHGLGHSIGLEVHEMPSFSAANLSPIPAGAVMSVEPGLYLPGRGGVRIEDLVLVCEEGYENMNHFSKELQILGR